MELNRVARINNEILLQLKVKTFSMTTRTNQSTNEPILRKTAPDAEIIAMNGSAKGIFLVFRFD